MDDNEIRKTLERYKFYHVIQLTDTVSTPGWSDPGVLRTQAMVLDAMRSLDLKGKRVLDIGCRDGLLSFAAERMGASEVIGIDNDLSQGATEFLIPFLKSRVRMHQLNIYDLTKEHFGGFDVVICAGVLYHLGFPFLGLKRIADVLVEKGTLVLEPAVRLDDNREALLFCPIGLESPYEPTSCTFFNSKGLSDSLRSFDLEVRRAVYLDGRQRPSPPPKRTLRSRVSEMLGIAKSQPPTAEMARVAFTCELVPTDVLDPINELREYWYGTHTIHTVRGGPDPQENS